MRIVIRCDVGQDVGSGHVMRCRVLARELRRCGSQVSFVLGEAASEMVGMVHPEFDCFWEEEKTNSVMEGGLDAQAYEYKDALRTITLLAGRDVDWVIVDNYRIGVTWETLIRNKTMAKVMAIDDLADRSHNCDILLDQNWYGFKSTERYKRLVAPNCNKLIGPCYALIGEDYRNLWESSPVRTSPVKSVIVYFGSVDRLNLTSQICEILTEKEFSHLKVEVVVGSLLLHERKLRELTQGLENVRLMRSVPSLGPFLASADIGIGAGGSTTWERCCVGLPTIVVSTALNQEEICKTLESESSIIYLGKYEKFKKTKCREAISRLINCPDLLERISERCKQYTDGLGASRVAAELSSYC